MLQSLVFLNYVNLGSSLDREHTINLDELGIQTHDLADHAPL
jgi:hypothetical protein